MLLHMSKEFSYQFYSHSETALDAMLAAILTAKISIYWELYIFLDDVEGQKFVAALADKARAGVEVKLILDAFGSLGFQSEELLKRAGVQVIWYNRLVSPWHKWKLWHKIINRNHRKMLIIDNEIGFLGGVNVSTVYRKWDDLHLRLTGLPVRQLQYGFAKSWIKAGGSRKAVRHILRPKLMGGLEKWRERLTFIIHSPSYRSERFLWRTFRKAVAVAKESVTFVTPYYIPDKRFLRLVARAARRGVKIDIILPARPDVGLMQYMAQKYFVLTQKAGARILLLNKMNHGKAVAVDNTFGMVSSINLTPRSFKGNEESGVSFTDENMVKELNGILDNWKREAQVVPDQNSLNKWTLAHRFWRWLGDRIEKYL